MPKYNPAPGALALYKIRPALVTQVSDKIDIELEGDKSKRVRSKDIEILHPGPLNRLSDLDSLSGNVEEAWELLEDGETQLDELAELIYGDFTPVTAWAAWELVSEGLYFEGSPERICARSESQIAADRAEQAAKAAAAQAWDDFLGRMKRGKMDPEDRQRLIEVEKLALGQTSKSRILQALERQENQVNAHKMLTGVGYWPSLYNPYPQRQSLPLNNPDLAIEEFPQEERLDLTHLAAYAIDDEGSEDPDDAISLDGECIWVHVADVAALVAPDSELDLEARARSANLYLPERVLHMLPPAATHKLGLGLQQESPALSIGFTLDEEAGITDIAIAISRIKATRCSYDEIQQRLHEEPFAGLKAHCDRFHRRRMDAGAATINLPEVSVRVKDDDIHIKPLPRLESRQMVADAMMMAGEAVARYALANDLPIPFATQPPPENPSRPEGMAASFAYRRQLKPSRLKTQEEPHSGLGLEAYARVTSPLRRYLDLVIHQQLRAHLQGRELMSLEQITERIGAAEAVGGAVRRAERLSNSHWKLIYLQRNPGWRGRAVVVEMSNNRATLIIPELALETKIRVRQDMPLDAEVEVAVREIDLEDLTAWFRLVEN
ncbi:MAG: RNB domain-containing ribonuclease [Candidatus Sedimenticola sp. (ex Thyasira tokunagai)]